MYGTIARIHPKPGRLDAIREVMAYWNEERRPFVPGAHDGYLFVPDTSPYPDRETVFLVAIFDDEASYRANAEDLAQRQWYLRLRDELTDDPEWMDGAFEVGSEVAAG